jgi:hypothetical protein
LDSENVSELLSFHQLDRACLILNLVRQKS